MSYKYTLINLLETPEDYSYSDCSGDDFLGDYRMVRKAFLGKISELFEQEFAEALLKMYRVIDIDKKLIKKFENKKAFFQNSVQSNLVALANLSFALSCHIKELGAHEELAYLSTLLKVNDTLCSLDVAHFDQVSACMVFSGITNELKLVEKLQNNGGNLDENV